MIDTASLGLQESTVQSYTQYTVICTVHSVQCTINSEQCRMNRVQCTVYSMHSLVWAVPCAPTQCSPVSPSVKVWHESLWGAQCTHVGYTLHWKLYTLYYTMYTLHHCTVCSVHCILYTVPCPTQHSIREAYNLKLCCQAKSRPKTPLPPLCLNFSWEIGAWSLNSSSHKL